MVAHEYAHGYAAWKQGDSTSYQLGYLSWNPVKYVDPFFTVLLPLLTFAMSGVPIGGARSGPINARNFRNYRRGDIVVSLAGVTANALIALVCALLVWPLYLLGAAIPVLASSIGILQVMLLLGISLNLILVLLNLLPIPPFDGSRVMKYILPPAWAIEYEKLRPYGFFILVALVTLGRPVLALWLSPASTLFSVAERLLVPYVHASPLTQ